MRGRLIPRSGWASTGGAFSPLSGGALGALLLAACDSLGPRVRAEHLLKFAERKNESLERALS